MRKRPLSLSLFAIVLAASVLWSAPALAQKKDTWTGKVIDLACYVAQSDTDASDEDCDADAVKNGQPMGLLTDDGTLVLLVAHPEAEKAYQALTKYGGRRMEVTGSLAEKDGMKVVTVTGSKAAG